MTNPLFADQANTEVNDTIDDSTDYATEIIGDGKKYKDLSAAAKALIEKDRFIERLKAENAEARASLRGEQKMDEFLEKIRAINNSGTASTQVTNPGETATNQNQNNQTQISKALTAEEVQELLERRDREKQEAANLSSAVQKVREAFGANYTSVMQQKAAELGMTPEYLTSLAKTQPKAFLKLVEADAPPQTRSVPPATAMNTAAFAANTKPNDRNNAYYSELRKKVGDAEFFRPNIQNQLHKDAQRLGEAFFR